MFSSVKEAVVTYTRQYIYSTTDYSLCRCSSPIPKRKTAEENTSMISDPVKCALDIIWQAQYELWQPTPDFRRVHSLGLDALSRLHHPRHRANACLVIAKAHEGLRNWFLAVMYWEEYKALYPEGWVPEMEIRLAACRACRDAQERLERRVAGGS